MGNTFKSYTKIPENEEERESQGSIQTDDQQKGTQISDIIGSYGPWQRKVFILAFLTNFPNSWNAMVISLIAPNIDHWCSPPNSYKNLTVAQWRNYAIPFVEQDDKSTFSKCKMYNLSNIGYLEPPDFNSTILCSSWEYDHTKYDYTIIDEWDLVCSREWLVSLSQSIYMAGFMVAVFVFGSLSDRIGRRPVILVCLAINVVFGLAIPFSTNYLMFTFLRFFSALGASGGITTGFVLLMEVLGPAHRAILGVATNLGWSAAYVLLGGLGWLLKDWTYIQLSISIPCVATVLYWWFLPESPRLLLTLGKYDEAEMLLRKAMSENGKDISDLKTVLENLMVQIKKENATKTRGTALDLLKTPNMRKKTLNIYLCWFVTAFVYYGLSLNTNNLGGDPILNFLISGALEFPSYLATIFILMHSGRKKPLVLTMLVGGLGCLLSTPVPEGLSWVRVTLAMLGKFCITSSFAIIYVFSAELYPTVVRNVGVGSSSTCGRIGSMIAPFVKELGTITNPGVPLAVFGGLSVISGLLVLLLPETKNAPIPDTLQEGEDFGKKRSAILLDFPSET